MLHRHLLQTLPLARLYLLPQVYLFHLQPPVDPYDPLTLPPPPVDKLPPPTKRSNPGPLDRCDQEIQRVLRIDTFDGARFELQKVLSPNFVTAHSVYMGSTQHEKGSCKFFFIPERNKY